MAFLKTLKKLQKNKKIPKWVTRQRVQGMLILALALLLLFQIGQVSELQEKVEKMDVLEETSTNVLQEWSEGKDFLTNFGGDLNEIRKFLLLPTKDYDFGDMVEVDLAEEEEDLNTLFFTYVEKLGEYEENQARYDGNLAAFQAALAEGFWTENGLGVNGAGNFGDEAVDFSFVDASGLELFKVSLGYDGLFAVDTYDGKLDLLDKKSAGKVVTDLKSFVQGDFVALKERIARINANRTFLSGILASAMVQDALTQEALTVGTELESNRYYYQILNSDHSPVAELAIFKEDGNMILKLEKPVTGAQDFFDLNGMDAESVLVSAILDGVDSRSDRQIRVEENRAEVENIFNDTAFKAVLGELGLTFGIVTETDARISWPLMNAEGAILRVIFIDKATGEVNATHPDGQDSQTLSMAVKAFEWMGKKKLSTPHLT
ncbi:hypothetical protein A2974_02820 [Candidatus Peregrinibacteria bacterium RIFCSPLOWO2_01_FULL_48_20]|nr:MAG: hypothetical protein A2974_02820 [Candidatus Peregrinibacteria bacterium RIFCSPLOWO2_01_FULL_48_20]